MVCSYRRFWHHGDTLDAQKFRAITRWGDLDKVLAGIEAARADGAKMARERKMRGASLKAQVV